MLTPSQDQCLRVIAASLIEIASYNKMQARGKYLTDDLGFDNPRWNRETEDRLNTFFNQLADAVDSDAEVS